MNSNADYRAAGLLTSGDKCDICGAILVYRDGVGALVASCGMLVKRNGDVIRDCNKRVIDYHDQPTKLEGV